MIDRRLQDPNAFDPVRVVVGKQRGGYISTLSLIEGTFCRTTERCKYSSYSINLNTSSLLDFFFTGLVRGTTCCCCWKIRFPNFHHYVIKNNSSAIHYMHCIVAGVTKNVNTVNFGTRDFCSQKDTCSVFYWGGTVFLSF